MPYVDSKAIKYGSILFNNFKRGATDMFRVYRENELIWTKFGVPSDENFYATSLRSGGPYVFQSWNKSGDLLFELDSVDYAFSGFGRGMIIVGDYIYVANQNKVAKITKNGTVIWNVLGRAQDPSFSALVYTPAVGTLPNRIIAIGSGRIGTSLLTQVSINADTGAILTTGTGQYPDNVTDASGLSNKWVHTSLRIYDTTYTVWYGNIGLGQKTDADWRYDQGSDSFSCFLHSSGVYVGGRLNVSPEPANFSLVKLNTSGSVVWQKNNVNNNVYSIYVDNSNNVYCSGTRRSNLTTHKLDSSGNILWSRDHGSVVWSISVDESNGDVYTTGNVISDISTRKYNSSGTLIWSRRVKTPTTISYSGVFG
jgi:hypothetical protein